MPEIAFVRPIHPDKTEEYKRFIHDLQVSRREEYVEARRLMGVKRIKLWIQRTRRGDLLITYYDVEDVDRLEEGLTSSQRPFDVWFRERVREYHGVSLEEGPQGAPPELILDLATDGRGTSDGKSGAQDGVSHADGERRG